MGNRCTNPEDVARKENDKAKEKWGVKTPTPKKTLTCENTFSDVFVGVKVDQT
jgi:hypothetical protein